MKEYLKELIKEQFRKVIVTLKISFYVSIMLVIVYFVLKLAFGIQLPSWSWWSTTLLSDNKTSSIITEVESSGYNIRKVQSIDVFGRVCTDTYAVAGTSTDCDYPPIERRDWTIEDYKKLLKK